MKKDNDDNDDANANATTNAVTNNNTIVTKVPGSWLFMNVNKCVVSNNDNQWHQKTWKKCDGIDTRDLMLNTLLLSDKSNDNNNKEDTTDKNNKKSNDKNKRKHDELIVNTTTNTTATTNVSNSNSNSNESLLNKIPMPKAPNWDANVRSNII